MASKQLLLIALTLLASASAHAGRDESLIQITRKNQLAYEAKLRKEQQQQKLMAQPAKADSAVQAPNNGASSEQNGSQPAMTASHVGEIKPDSRVN